ncbi:MAG TPA: hypothetical protein VGM54_24320 [Chthoniobacter sp.]|jgi:hypothetical protein
MEERPPNFVERLTIPGRLLLVASVLLFAGSVAFVFYAVTEHAAFGIYPVAVFFMPACVWSALFFFLTARILEACGVRIYANRVRK